MGQERVEQVSFQLSSHGTEYFLHPAFDIDHSLFVSSTFVRLYCVLVSMLSLLVYLHSINISVP